MFDQETENGVTFINWKNKRNVDMQSKWPFK